MALHIQDSHHLLATGRLFLPVFITAAAQPFPPCMCAHAHFNKICFQVIHFVYFLHVISLPVTTVPAHAGMWTPASTPSSNSLQISFPSLLSFSWGNRNAFGSKLTCESIIFLGVTDPCSPCPLSCSCCCSSSSSSSSSASSSSSSSSSPSSSLRFESYMLHQLHTCNSCTLELKHFFKNKKSSLPSSLTAKRTSPSTTD